MNAANGTSQTGNGQWAMVSVIARNIATTSFHATTNLNEFDDSIIIIVMIVTVSLL